MSSIERAPYHHGHLREALLQQAIAQLDEAGPDSVTIRAVARRTGVSHAAPANHFADRTALLTAVAARLFGELTDLIERRLLQLPRIAAARARGFVDTLLDYGLSQPNRYRLMWRRDLTDWNDAALTVAMDGLYDRLVAEIESMRSDATVDQHTLAVGLWSMVHGYVSLRIDGVFTDRADAVSGKPRREAILDLILSG